jgi:hypothetical protein
MALLICSFTVPQGSWRRQRFAMLMLRPGFQFGSMTDLAPSAVSQTQVQETACG